LSEFRRVATMHTDVLSHEEQPAYVQGLDGNYRPPQALPAMALSGIPITCHTVTRNAFVVMVDKTVQFNRVISLDCECSVGYALGRGDTCIDINTIPWIAHSGNMALVVFLCLLVAAIPLGWILLRYMQRGRRLEGELGLQEHLLAQQTDEVAALKRTWELHSSDVALVARIDGASPGVSGGSRRGGLPSDVNDCALPCRPLERCGELASGAWTWLLRS
jgi:hypothetical protein